VRTHLKRQREAGDDEQAMSMADHMRRAGPQHERARLGRRVRSQSTEKRRTVRQAVDETDGLLSDATSGARTLLRRRLAAGGRS
jgi:hypothetical protein